jgi:hypothetical protein
MCVLVLGMMDNILGGLSLDSGMTFYFTGFVIVSITLNILLTVMITYKLLVHRRMMSVAAVGSTSTPLTSHYATVVTLVVESAIAWTVASLLYLITGITNSSTSYFFEYVFHIAAVSTCSPIVASPTNCFS